MWLTGVLLSYLVLAKPSTADLGFPVSIPGLRSRVDSVISTTLNYRKPFNKTLQDLDALPVTNLGFDFQQVRSQWLNAMVNLSRIQNATLNNLTKAIDDKSSGFRKVLDGLYGSLKSFKQQVAANQDVIGRGYELKGGSSNIRSLNITRTLLDKGLDRLLDALKALDDVISKAQRVQPLTEFTIVKYVKSDLSWDVWSAVVKIIDSTIQLDSLANRTLAACRLAAQDTNDTRGQLEKMINWKDVETLYSSTMDVASKVENTTVTLIGELNQTVWIAYGPLIKDKLNQEDTNEIVSFLKSFVEAMQTLSKSVPDLSQKFFGYAADSIPWFQQSIEQRVESILDSAAEDIFANGNISFSENCTRKHPLINETLSKTFALMKSCTWKQLEELPNITEAIEEYLQPISEAVLTPLADLQTCTTAKLDQNLCLRTFVTTYISESSLMAAISRLKVQTHRKIENEFAEVSIWLQSCSNPNVALDILDELLHKREVCYGKRI